MILEDLYTLTLNSLILGSPVLSGNMRNNITVKSIKNNECIIEVSGPSYDGVEWRKTGNIIHTNKYDYAMWVNNIEASTNGKSNRNYHWINKICLRSAQYIAPMYNAEAILDV